MSNLAPKLSRSLLLSACMMFTYSASAQLTLDVDLGYSMPSASEYESSLYSSASVGYQSDSWLGQIGFVRLGEFELENAGEETHLDSQGPFVLMSRRLKTQWFDWEFGLGAARLESVATLQGYEIQREANWEPLVKLAVQKFTGRRLALTGGYTYYHDVVGANVSAIALGLRWSF